MLEHAAQKHQGICESHKFAARHSCPPASLCGPLPRLWIFSSTIEYDG